VRIKAIAIFGASYALAMGVGLTFTAVAIRAAGVDTSYEKTLQNIGLILNILVFAFAISLALSRQVHEVLGGAPGPLAFRSILMENRIGLAAGFAVLAVLVDQGAFLFASAYFTGEVRIPSFGRLVVMAVIYGGLAWMVISHTKVPLHGRR
jgi:hypothetical protein